MAKNIALIRCIVETSYIEQYPHVLFYSHTSQSKKRIKPLSGNQTILVDLASYLVNTQSASVLVRSVEMEEKSSKKGKLSKHWNMFMSP